MYCGSCGDALSATARFCRSCGASQEGFSKQHAMATPPPVRAPVPAPAHPTPLPPPPPPPNPGAWSQSNATGNRFAAYLAIAGGIGMCLMVLYTIVYLPLHYDSPVNFGESLQFGDLLAFGSGALAVVLGAFALR